jgi:UDP-N-acetylmuramate--alanine ligase
MTLPARIHMVGIGGIGMSALAQYLAHAGYHVRGSDREESPTTALLASKGVDVSIGTGEIGDAQMLIYSDAVPVTNTERIQARERGIPELSYFEALGVATRSTRTISVAGTHGKTTTTGMLAKILQSAGKDPTAIIGSIVRDFNSNFVASTTHKSDLWVVEACEYRDHLLKLTPTILVITNIELDHTDYFPTIEALRDTFRKAVATVPAHGAIVTNTHDPEIALILDAAVAPIVDYSHTQVPLLNQIGVFNSMNARAAKTAALVAYPDIPESLIDETLSGFHGSWRRFEYRGETPKGAQVYDDYAHHPTAIQKTIEAARERFPDKRIVVAFHPHLYSRTKSFFDDFARALAIADRAYVAPIYAAREEIDPDVSSELLAERARTRGGDVRALSTFDSIREALLEEDAGSLIITMGAGDIYKVAEQIAD